MKRFALALILPVAALCGCESPTESSRAARGPARAGSAASTSGQPSAPAQEAAPAQESAPARRSASRGAPMNETAPPRPTVQTATFGLG